MLSFRLTVTSGCSGQKTHSPKQDPGEGDLAGPTPQASHLTRSFSTRSSQLSLDNLWKALACRGPSLYGFCNKVLIHVNLCGDYCVQQYFLVYLFFLCDVSLFFFLIYKCLIFF